MTDITWQHRTQVLLGTAPVQALAHKHVLVVGLGGVGAYAAEMLVRAGVGELTIVDGDNVDVTNINRQLPALLSTVGMPKTEVLQRRFKDINPQVNIHVLTLYVEPHDIEHLFRGATFHYVIDAIDSMIPKCHLAVTAVKYKVPIVSAMGAGGKTDLAKIQVADIAHTYQCHLAAGMRKRLRKMGIYKGVKAVFSSEEAVAGKVVPGVEEGQRPPVGTISYMPAVFGCWCAQVCLTDMLNGQSKEL